jgi:hypothetical protein
MRRAGSAGLSCHGRRASACSGTDVQPDVMSAGCGAIGTGLRSLPATVADCTPRLQPYSANFGRVLIRLPEAPQTSARRGTCQAPPPSPAVRSRGELRPRPGLGRRLLARTARLGKHPPHVSLAESEDLADGGFTAVRSGHRHLGPGVVGQETPPRYMKRPSSFLEMHCLFCITSVGCKGRRRVGPPTAARHAWVAGREASHEQR